MACVTYVGNPIIKLMQPCKFQFGNEIDVQRKGPQFQLNC
jgi:hypothetical protein